MKLTGREKSELFFEGIVTVILLLLLNLSVLVIITQAIQLNPGLRDGIFIIKQSIVIGPDHFQLWSWENLFIGLMAILDVWVVYWRLMRRYRQMQLYHIIDELHYIAQGNFGHRIQFKVSGDIQHVVDSVNALVDSVLESMTEERDIERSKDELITNVSHDLRTPLTSVIGYLGLIEDKQYRSEADILKYTHTAFLKASQMKALVEDLFEYTKVQQAAAKVNFNQVDLSQMMEQISASFELEAEKQDKAIEVTCEESPLMIDADAEQLSRVFNNLISNALKYGDGGKHIYMIANRHNDKEIEIKVANDGPKIPKESLDHVFERFYRVEESRNKATGGTGLGLAITQSIVQLHHGSITVESTDKMTTFDIILPIRQAKVDSDEDEAVNKVNESLQKQLN